MMFPEVADIAALVAILASIFVGLIKVRGWWRGRPSETVPNYHCLKASQNDLDPDHWVLILSAPLGTPLIDNEGKRISVLKPRGKVASITRKVVTLNHPRRGKLIITLSDITQVWRVNGEH